VTVPEGRPRRRGTWLLTVLALAASVGFLGLRLAGASDGAAVAFYADAWTNDGVEIGMLPGPASGLRNHDVVLAVAGRPLADWLDGALSPTIDRAPLSAPQVPYTVRRGGQVLDVAATVGRFDVTGLLGEYWSALVLVLVFQGVAAYVLWRRPGASAAVALAIAAVAITGSTIPWLLGLEVSDITAGWPFLLYAATAGGLYMLLWPAGALHLPLAMTSAKGPNRRALVAIYGVPLGAYAVAAAAARIAAPSSVAWMGSWPLLQTAVIIPTVLVGAGLTIRGYRSTPSAVRAQLRWVTIGGGITVIASLVLLWVPQLLVGRPLMPWSAIGLVALPLPLGIAASVLRYGLFEIEVVVNRALVYGGATASIVAIYVASVSVLGRVLGVDAGFSASLLATGLAAVAAIPIRDVLQRSVNRLMYGDRDDPYRALSRLGGRLEGTLDPLEAPAIIVRTVAESLRLPGVALRIGGPDEPGRTISHGLMPEGAATSMPLTFGGEVVGELVVAQRSATEPLSAADLDLLAALARQAGAAVHAMGLALDLIASRERLVAAREEERRRIRRDLHDGLGPTLAGIGLRAEVAADLVARDAPGAQRVLDEMRAEVAGALADIRRLVDALRPPALDELGLVGALQAQAGHLGADLRVDVAATGDLPDLSAAVEVAAYRIAAEAMTNAARHSGAQRCRVRLSASSGPGQVLEVEVGDDGNGLPEHVRPGIGLASMRERAAEVGGTCVVEARAGGGTRVLARLPLDAGAGA
jgi:signal transduction histidine kinase